MKPNEYQQYLHDKIKEMKLKGEAWIGYDKFRMRIIPYPPKESLKPIYQEYNCIVSNKGKLNLAFCNFEGPNSRFKYTTDRGAYSFYAREDRIRALVTDIYRR